MKCFHRNYFFALIASASVSYTHLDVYKRQVTYHKRSFSVLIVTPSFVKVDK